MKEPKMDRTTKVDRAALTAQMEQERQERAAECGSRCDAICKELNCVLVAHAEIVGTQTQTSVKVVAQ